MLGTARSGTCVDVVPMIDGLPRKSRAAWESIVAEQPVYSVFQYPEWLDLALRAGIVQGGFAVIISDGDRPIGLLPCYTRTRWTAEIIQPLNPNPSPLLLIPGDEAQALQGLACWLQRGPTAMVTIGCYGSDQLAQFTEWGSRQGMYSVTRHTDSMFWLSLPSGWDDYLHSLHRNKRYMIRHAEKAIYDDYPDAEITREVNPARCEEAIEALMQFSRLRWQHERQHSVFERPRTVEYYRRFMRWVATHGYGYVAVLRIHHHIIAAATVLHLPGSSVAYYHQVGRDMAYLPGRYSPGTMLLGQIIRWAIADGVTQLSLGLGVMSYKLDFGGIEHPQMHLMLARSAQAAAVLQKVDPAMQVLSVRVKRLLRRR